MSAESRERFADALRSEQPDLGLACLLIGVEAAPDLDVARAVARLDELADLTAGYVAGTAPHEVARGLREALGDVAGFRGYGDDYLDLRASLLHEVLERRRGLPILLSVVYLEVARRLGVPLHGIGLPGHFLVGVPAPDVLPVLLDPFYGGRPVSVPEMEARIGDMTGAPALLGADDLAPWPVPDIVLRVLSNVRALSRHRETLRTRLWATDLSLLVPGHPAALYRERAELLVALGDFLGAAAQFEQYAGFLAPVDPAGADLALRAGRMARARLC